MADKKHTAEQILRDLEKWHGDPTKFEFGEFADAAAPPPLFDEPEATPFPGGSGVRTDDPLDPLFNPADQEPPPPLLGPGEPAGSSSSDSSTSSGVTSERDDSRMEEVVELLREVAAMITVQPERIADLLING